CLATMWRIHRRLRFKHRRLAQLNSFFSEELSMAGLRPWIIGWISCGILLGHGLPASMAKGPAKPHRAELLGPTPGNPAPRKPQQIIQAWLPEWLNPTNSSMETRAV